GALAPADYRRSVLPASAKVFEAVAGYGVPRIHFGVGTGELLGLMGEAGADVVGVDWRVPLDEAARRVGPGKALQGNFDPTVLFA
ncbi:uroporphyrinogen decarboxylase, partial [Xylella fastidiosa subsp. multiplex]|nr:uroporphyrinogen decarboxylase [Xylella fastidiosa subsp. multiplex]